MKWLATAFVLFLVFVIYLANTGTPNIFNDAMRAVPYGDKIGHFLLMGTLALLVNLAMTNHGVAGKLADGLSLAAQRLLLCW